MVHDRQTGGRAMSMTCCLLTGISSTLWMRLFSLRRSQEELLEI